MLDEIEKALLAGSALSGMFSLPGGLENSENTPPRPNKQDYFSTPPADAGIGGAR
jgi:hypothetical protein